MRTSAKITLALSIVLLLLGVGLVLYGTYLSIPQPEIIEYSVPGFRYSYSYTSYSSHYSLASSLCSQFGHLSFLAGLISMFIFTYLAVHPVKKNDECKCEKKHDEKVNEDKKDTVEAEAKTVETAKGEAETEEKKAEIPHVIELGGPVEQNDVDSEPLKTE